MNTTASSFTDAHVHAVGQGLLDHSWPLARWRHPEHCIATVYLLLCRPDIDLDAELPEIIRSYNVSQGGENTDSRGYHHTITVFYLNAIRTFLAGLDPALPISEKCARLLASPAGSKDHVLAFYSRERLFTPEARLGLIQPDKEAATSEASR